MLRLLIQRGSVLVLRPAALLAEGFLLSNENLLIFVLPAAAMALTMSSVPVYIEFLSTNDFDEERARVKKDYISGLLTVTMLSLIAISAILFAISTALIVSVAVLATFLVEKFADELTRFHEFRKEYIRWFVVQSSRSLWLFIPIILAKGGSDYRSAFGATAAVAALGMGLQFFRVTKLRLSFDLKGWSVAKRNSSFLGSSGILAFNRQVPRLAVAYFFPQIAHTFQALAQVNQGVSLIFNVKYLVPYRKMIARRTFRFERHLRPTFFRIRSVVVGLSFLGGFVSIATSDGWFFLVGLSMAMLADALAFSLMAAYLGLIPWFLAPSTALATLAIAGCILATIYSALYAGLILGGGSLVLVPMASTLLSLAVMSLIVRRHLPEPPRA